MVTYPSLCSACVTQGALCHAIGYQVLLTPAFNVIPHPSVSYRQVLRPILYFQASSSQDDSLLCPNPYLGKQRISRGVTIILSMCPCPYTQLDSNQFTITPRFIFLHVKTAKILIVVKTLIKKTQSSSHTNQQP